MSKVYIHPSSEVFSKKIGQGSTIWQFCVILEGATIGESCNVNAHCFIENDVVVGDRVTVKCGVYLWDGILVEDDVFIGPNVTFCNDKYPKSKQPPPQFIRTILKKGASIGAGSVILPGVTIHEGAMVGAGSVVTRDVPPHSTVFGNPAKVRKKRND